MISWIHKLTEVKLEPGIYKLARQLKNGQTLVKLVDVDQGMDLESFPKAV